jgi:hypothetical protein
MVVQRAPPGTDRWSALPPLPEPRAGGAAAILGDGSVLATVVRFVPEH